jgi:hypothetical protein
MAREGSPTGAGGDPSAAGTAAACDGSGHVTSMYRCGVLPPVLTPVRPESTRMVIVSPARSRAVYDVAGWLGFAQPDGQLGVAESGEHSVQRSPYQGVLCGRGQRHDGDVVDGRVQPEY